MANEIRFQMVESGSTITACKLLGDVPVSHQPDAEDFNLYVRTVGSTVKVDRSDTDETIVSAVGFEKAMTALANHYCLPVVVVADYGVKVTKRAESMLGRFEPTLTGVRYLRTPDGTEFRTGVVCEQTDRAGDKHLFVITAILRDLVVFRDLSNGQRRGNFNRTEFMVMAGEGRIVVATDYAECICDVIFEAGWSALPAGGRACGGCGSIFTVSSEEASDAVLAEQARVSARNDGAAVIPTEQSPATEGTLVLTERHYAERLKVAIPAGTVLMYRREDGSLIEWTVSRVTWDKVIFAEKGIAHGLEWSPSVVAGWLDAGYLTLVDTSLPFTDRDMRDQVVRALDGREAQFDINAIMDVFRHVYGTVDIELIPVTSFWLVVNNNHLSSAELVSNRMVTALVAGPIKPHIATLLGRRTRKASKRKASKVNRRKVKGGF